MSDEKNEKQMLLADFMAVLLLKEFIQMGFPSPDPKTQVALAYAYAEQIIAYRESRGVTSSEEVPTEPSTMRCPKCGSENMKVIDMRTYTNPSAKKLLCPHCKWEKNFQGTVGPEGLVQ